MKVKVKKLDPNAKLPTYAHDGDAGFDIYTSQSATVENLSTEILHTGLAFEIPEGYSLEIYPRSGLSGDHPNYLANGIGLLDSSYRGELLILFRNNSFNKCINIPSFTRIAQGVIRSFEHVEFEEVDELKKSERGESGLGSSGVN